MPTPRKPPTKNYAASCHGTSTARDSI
jgi:hypothetical protein